MWTSVVESSDMKRVLPGGQNWCLHKQTFDGQKMQIELRGHSSEDQYSVEFEPIYYAVSDEWAQAYGGIPQKAETCVGLNKVKSNIEKAWPDQKGDYEGMEAYFISAMEWDIRFIANAEPIVTKLK